MGSEMCIRDRSLLCATLRAAVPTLEVLGLRANGARASGARALVRELLGFDNKARSGDGAIGKLREVDFGEQPVPHAAMQHLERACAARGVVLIGGDGGAQPEFAVLVANPGVFD